MKRIRSVALAAVVAVGFAAVAIVGQPPAPTGARMADAAKSFLTALSPELTQKAKFSYDDTHRLKWYFTPQQDKQKQATRVGARLEELSSDQKVAALALLKTGLSAKGFEQAITIMSLENLLSDLEGPKGAMTRNPAWYFVSVFGDPSNTGKWSWRFEGHHMSVNYTLDKGEVVAATPLTFGSNPADVKEGPRKGLRNLAGVEDPAKVLIASLTPEQNKTAKQAKHFAEIKEGSPTADVGAPVGITAAQLTAEQRKTLMSLLAAYTERMPDDLAAAETKRATGTPPEKLYFGYSGSTEPGKGYTYRVQGTDFVVEFLNLQADSAKNPANHIHSTWRLLPGDFGLAK